ncbi:hypothetical protein ACFFF5_14790 [Lederbergia wuyishanensis]
MLIAFADNVTCGLVYGYILSPIKRNTPKMFLYSIDVLPEYQNKGIG